LISQNFLIHLIIEDLIIWNIEKNLLYLICNKSVH